MPMTLISLMAPAISSRCTMSLAMYYHLGGPEEPPPEPCQNTRNGGYTKDQALLVGCTTDRGRNLGITIDKQLSVSDYVDTTLSSCCSLLYALLTLRARWMPQKTLHQVTAATTNGQLMYGSLAWWGYSSERDLNRLDSFIRRAKWGGFLPDEAPSFREMEAQADSSLFKTLISTQTMSSEVCVHCALTSSITSALDPTLSTSQLVTIETFSPALCFSAHINYYFYFYMMFLL